MDNERMKGLESQLRETRNMAEESDHKVTGDSMF